MVPDLCSIPNDRLGRFDHEARVPEGVIPDRAIELLSASTREIGLVEKVGISRDAGVSEDWVFDRHAEV